jgi:hypothetical protein
MVPRVIANSAAMAQNNYHFSTIAGTFSWPEGNTIEKIPAVSRKAVESP